MDIRSVNEGGRKSDLWPNNLNTHHSALMLAIASLLTANRSVVDVA